MLIFLPFECCECLQSFSGCLKFEYWNCPTWPWLTLDVTRTWQKASSVNYIIIPELHIRVKWARQTLHGLLIRIPIVRKLLAYFTCTKVEIRSCRNAKSAAKYHKSTTGGYVVLQAFGRTWKTIAISTPSMESAPIVRVSLVDKLIYWLTAGCAQVSSSWRTANCLRSRLMLTRPMVRHWSVAATLTASRSLRISKPVNWSLPTDFALKPEPVRWLTP